MLIDKAIEILTDSSKQNTMLITGDDIDALRLGIEALKFIDYCRSGTFEPPFELLPGETKE